MLTSGQSVTLEDGTVITPDMVSERPVPANAFELVFLPDACYVDSFISENARFHQLLQQVVPDRAFNMALVYHAAQMSVLENAAFR